MLAAVRYLPIPISVLFVVISFCTRTGILTHPHSYNNTTTQHGTQDGNDGLAQRVLDQHAVKGLQKLARTFQTLALDGAPPSLASNACLLAWGWG